MIEAQLPPMDDKSADSEEFAEENNFKLNHHFIRFRFISEAWLKTRQVSHFNRDASLQKNHSSDSFYKMPNVYTPLFLNYDTPRRYVANKRRNMLDF